MSESEKTAAALLYAALRDRTDFPKTLAHTMTLDDAYGVQFALLEQHQHHEDQQAGWKVGLTAKAMQEQQGMHEPVFGHLLQSGHLTSPASLPFESLVAPGFENELCLKLNRPLSGAEVGFDEATAAIGAVAPAIELIEKRGLIKSDLSLIMAGNAQQRAFITGAFTPFRADMDLAAVSVSVAVNGEEKETALGAEVLGNPIHSVVWLTAKLAQFGRGLNAGDMIMSGSFTKQYDVQQGDHVAVTFTDFGTAEISFP